MSFYIFIVAAITHPRSGMHARDELRSRAVVFVIFQQKLASLFVQSRLRIGIYEEALDRDKDVAYAVLRLPVLLQSVHTYFACWADVGVENLRGKPA